MSLDEMRLAIVALASLLIAAPALADQSPPQGQALSPQVVPGAGLAGVQGIRVTRFRIAHALGITSAGSVRLDLAAGPGNKLVLVRPNAVVFRALRFTSMVWADRSVLIKGIGEAQGIRVAFTALAVDGGRRDVLKLDWLHHASLGGVLRHGTVVIH